MRRPPLCCHLPTFTIVWDDEATEVTLNACSCWPHAAEVNDTVVWSEPGNGEAIVRAAAWVIRWAEARGAGCVGVTGREIDRAEANAHGQGVLRIRVSPKR